jgi:hypothetical protein
MEYHRLFGRLYDERVKYLICGGLAVNIYGIPRATADIDLLIEFTPENAAKFDKVLKELQYESAVPVGLSALLDETIRRNLVKTKNIIAYSYHNNRANYMNLDVLIDVPFSFEDMWNTKESRSLFQSTEVYIVSLAHLIAMKKYANRIQDKSDIESLYKLKNLPV